MTTFSKHQLCAAGDQPWARRVELYRFLATADSVYSRPDAPGDSKVASRARLWRIEEIMLKPRHCGAARTVVPVYTLAGTRNGICAGAVVADRTTVVRQCSSESTMFTYRAIRGGVNQRVQSRSCLKPFRPAEHSASQPLPG